MFDKLSRYNITKGIMFGVKQSFPGKFLADALNFSAKVQDAYFISFIPINLLDTQEPHTNYNTSSTHIKLKVPSLLPSKEMVRPL